MKKPKYFGEREFRSAIAALRQKIESSGALKAILPVQADAVYETDESDTIAMSILISRIDNRYRKEHCFKVDLLLNLKNDKRSIGVLVGDESAVRNWLNGIDSIHETHCFLHEVFRTKFEIEESVRDRW